jgi:hypothetical protein
VSALKRSCTASTPPVPVLLVTDVRGGLLGDPMARGCWQWWPARGSHGTWMLAVVACSVITWHMDAGSGGLLGDPMARGCWQWWPAR